MNSFMIASALLVWSSLALGASIGSPYRQETRLAQSRDPMELTGYVSDAAEQTRRARQLSLSGFLSNALGGGVGLVPGVGSLLSGPVTSLLQRPLSSTFGALTGGLVTRVGPDSEWQSLWSPAQGFGRVDAQSQPWAPGPLQYRQLQPDMPLYYQLN